MKTVRAKPGSVVIRVLARGAHSGRRGLVEPYALRQKRAEQRTGDDRDGNANQQRIENRPADVRLQHPDRRHRSRVGRHQSVHHRKAGEDRDADVQQRCLGLPRQQKHQRNQQDEPHLEEHRHADDAGDDHHRPVHALRSEPAHQCRRDPLGARRTPPASCRACCRTPRIIAIDPRTLPTPSRNPLSSWAGSMPAEMPMKSEARHERDDRIDLESGDEEDEPDHGKEGVDEQRRAVREAEEGGHAALRCRSRSSATATTMIRPMRISCT